MLLDVRRKAYYENSPEKIVGAKWYDPALVEEWRRFYSKRSTGGVFFVSGVDQ